MRKERPDLEEAKDRLVLSISADKKQLGELEDKILRLLKESSGNILDDEQLINTLNHSKTTSSVISARVQEAEVTEKSINEAREHYRPAATRGSILYFVIADLSLISPMYQFSLSYFAKMFSYCIDKSDKADDVPTRLGLLSDFVTRFIYNNVSRGLFEEHKLLYRWGWARGELHGCTRVAELVCTVPYRRMWGPVGPCGLHSKVQAQLYRGVPARLPTNSQ